VVLHLLLVLHYRIPVYILPHKKYHSVLNARTPEGYLGLVNAVKIFSVALYLKILSVPIEQLVTVVSLTVSEVV